MSERLCILLVDDDRLGCEMLRDMLCDRHEVRWVSAPLAALALLPYRLDLIIVDGRMPQMAGAEFVRQARQRYEDSGLAMPRFLGLTAYPEHEYRFQEVGVETLRKPYKIGDVERAVEGRSLRARLAAWWELLRALAVGDRGCMGGGYGG